MNQLNSLALCLTAGICAQACSRRPAGIEADAAAETDAESDGDDQAVEVLSPWASPGDAQSLQAVFDLYRHEYPDVRIVNQSFESFPTHSNHVDARLRDGPPFDVFQDTVNYLLDRVDRFPGMIGGLEDLWADLGLQSSVPEDVIAGLRYRGALYGVPVSILSFFLIYNTDVLKSHQVEPPTTTSNLIELCSKLKSAGVAAPVTIVPTGTRPLFLFFPIMVDSMGAEPFRDYLAGKRTADDAAVREGIELVATVFDHCVPAASDLPVDLEAALDLLMLGKAATMFGHELFPAYLEQLGWTPGVEFGVQRLLPEVFMFYVDVLGIPVDAPHPRAARNYVRTFTSPEGQIAFNSGKTALPVRFDVDRSKLDPLARDAMSDFETASTHLFVLPPGIPEMAWSRALLTFLQDRDRTKLHRAFAENPPMPK